MRACYWTLVSDVITRAAPMFGGRAATCIDGRVMRYASGRRGAAEFRSYWTDPRGKLHVCSPAEVNQCGDGIGLHFLHDPGAVRLHRLERDAHLVGDLLVEMAADYELQHFTFPRGQSGQPDVDLATLSLLGLGGNVPL